MSPSQYVDWYDSQQTGTWAPVATTIVFSSVFTTGSNDPADAARTMYELMKYTGSTQELLIMKFLSANYLNMATGRMPFLQMSMLNAIWTGWRTPGYPFRPSAGAAPWGYNEIIIYLMGTA